MKRKLAALSSAALVIVAAGCGGPAGDLFEVTRSGADRNANITLVVSDDGFVTCDGVKKELPPTLLLRARQLARDLSPQAELNLTLPAGPNSVLSYKARMAAGDIAFADTSRPLPASFTRLTAYTSDVAKQVCGKSRS
ncbi:hypothetical protein OM076_29895 [Solirubrobacter ginsenosidimutans]|uniref:Lipoprotein n=1 Tax=Solirubrobacter ginsenosidimutans TaxID=490573 RepID=A0A9X3S5U2_9ACTN|nr:hypothetical protein [Solirubrobacter ginsenosidimutans]MDA0164521.1 hypothetical protein [Solirubrobacter ginsenosidimutans]